MGTNTFTTKIAGDVLDPADPNQYKEALGVNHVPRNTSGVPTDEAGDLGQTIYRWANAYISGAINIGLVASGLSIEEASGELIIKVGGSEKMRVDASGIKRSSFPTLGVLRDLQVVEFSSSGTWDVPSNVTSIIVLASPGGGGGGAGGGTTSAFGGGGGGGGVGVDPRLDVLNVDPSETLTLTIGAAGAAGVGANGVSGTAGGSGGDTIVAGNNDTLTYRGGNGGAGGIVEGGGEGAGGVGGRSRGVDKYDGGKGGDKNGGTAGIAGDGGFYSEGGAAGTHPGGGSANGGNGGGGGAGYGDGGVGGNGGSTTPSAGAAPSAASYGAGGGGGGGAGVGVAAGAHGGVGYPGIIRIYYVE